MNKPASGDVVDVTTAISDQMGILDRAAIVEPCTSATRPSTNLFDGKLILETDTKMIMRYRSPDWEHVQNPNYPRGRVASVLNQVTGDTVAAGQEKLVHANTKVTFTAYAGRKYMVTAQGSLIYSAGANADSACVLRCRYASGASVTTAGTSIGAQGVDYAVNNLSATGGFHVAYVKPFSVTATGQITLGLFLQVATGSPATILMQAPHQSILVEDLGEA